MKQLEYIPQTLNAIIYEIQKVEVLYQKAKDEYEILDENEKDFLATLKVEISSREDVSNVEAETQARDSQEWKSFKSGKYQAKRSLGEAQARYKHLLRVMEAVKIGISYNQTLLKNNIHGELGK